MSLITNALIETLKQQFALDWTGIHGAPHWARVRENGLRLASATGASQKLSVSDDQSDSLVARCGCGKSI